MKVAAAALAEIAREHQVVVTHGNGPQIGLLALQSEAFRDVRTYPLDVLGAESEGMIGYLLERELGNVLGDRPVASLITQTVVDALDPAFQRPSKPIGPVYDAVESKALAKRAGLDGRARRRRMAPRRRVADAALDRRAADDPPAARTRCRRRVRGRRRGARRRRLGRRAPRRRGRRRQGRSRARCSPASSRPTCCCLLTDVPAVELDWGTPRGPAGADRSRRPSSQQIRVRGRARWGPKVARRGRRSSGRPAIGPCIGALADAAAIVDGTAGTAVVSADAAA